MRIDFSQFDSDQTAYKPHQLHINNHLLPFWDQQQQEKDVIKTQQNNPPSINFSVSYPFEVNRSLSPQSIHQQFSYMSAKQVLPKSTLNFIRTSIQKEYHKTEEEATPQKRPHESPARSNHSFYFQSKSKSKEKSKESIENRSPQICTLKPSPHSKKHNAPQNIGVRSQKMVKEQAEKNKKIAQEVLACRKDKEVAELTLRPVLNYTMNSKTAKRVQEKRKKHFASTHTSVFQTLYNDAARNSAKRQIEKMKIYQKTQKGNKKRSRMQIFTTFEERLKRSLEASAERKSIAQNKQEVNPSTGKKMFVPDTHLSKLSYYSHFKNSFSISPFLIEETPARPEHYSKESSRLNKSYKDITTTLNHSLGQISQLNRKCQGKPELVPTISGRREERLAELYADLLWKNGSLDSSSLTAEEEKVMSRFLQELSQFQYSASISQQVFMALFKDFLGRINLFDKGLLLQRLKKQIPSHQYQVSKSNANSSFFRSKVSNVHVPDHQQKFFYV